MKKFVYVDFENVNNLTSLVDIDGRYFIFIGASQKKISSELVLSSSNKTIEWIQISGNGKNALDFQLVYTLAMNSGEKDVEHIILSKDTGYDPLLSTLKKKNLNVKRLINLKDINREMKDHSINDSIDKIIANLMKINKTQRPQSVKKLEAHIKSLDKTLDNSKAHEAVDELFRRGLISSSGGSRIKYTD